MLCGVYWAQIEGFDHFRVFLFTPVCIISHAQYQQPITVSQLLVNFSELLTVAVWVK